MLFAALAALACNPTPRVPRESTNSSVSSGAGGQEIVARFLQGGWVVPNGTELETDPFAETLKAFIITTEEERRSFLDGLDLIRLRRSLEPLNRTDLAQEVVLGTYYLWRPLKGDPLSLVRTTLNGTVVEVSLELEEDPQGRERPYLMAPLYIVALKREELPSKVPMTFVFLLNGEVATTRTITLD